MSTGPSTVSDWSRLTNELVVYDLPASIRCLLYAVEAIPINHVRTKL